MRRPRALCRLEEVKRLLPNYQEPVDPTEQGNADTFLLDLIDSASQKIHEVAGREFVSIEDTGTSGNNDWPAPPVATRAFDVLINATIPADPAVGRKRTRYLKVGDLASLTAVDYGDPWQAPRFSIDLSLVRAQPLVRAPWQPIRTLEIFGDVWSEQVYDVSGRWGFPSVPMDVRLAAADQAAIWAGRDLRNFSQAFLEAVAAGSSPTEPRSLAQSVFDTAVAYQIPEIG